MNMRKAPAVLTVVALLALFGAAHWYHSNGQFDIRETSNLKINADSMAQRAARRLAAVSSTQYNVMVLLSSALTAIPPARQIISSLEALSGVGLDVTFQQPKSLTWGSETTALVIPALQADYVASVSQTTSSGDPKAAAMDVQATLKELLAYGGHIILTAPTDPRDMERVASLVTLLTNNSLTCSGDAVAGQELGVSVKTADASSYFTQSYLPSLDNEVHPLSCNFPGSTVPHYRSEDGYPTVVEWPRPLNTSEGSIWVLGFTYKSNSTAWNVVLHEILKIADSTLSQTSTFSRSRRPPSPSPPAKYRPPPPAWSTWSWTSWYSSYLTSPPPPPARPPPSPPPARSPPPTTTSRPCTTANLTHAQYDAPKKWFRSALPLLPCSHELNIQMVVPQCLDGSVVYWDAETGKRQLNVSDFSASCSSPCLTALSELYYRHGEVEAQQVYNTAAANCPALNRTRTCSNGEFGAWSVYGPQYRDLPCDGSCQDEEYDMGTVFSPGQTQVRIFFSSQYVSFGSSCASVAVARARTCSATGSGTFAAWSDGPAFTECFVQCPPPADDAETVASYAPSSGLLGEGAVLNRKMYGSSVADESGGCPAKVLQRTCGKPEPTRIRLETPLQQLAESYGEVRLAWLPSAPWHVLDPEYPHLDCRTSCWAPDGQFVPHGRSYSFLMYAAGGSIDSLPVAPPPPPSPVRPPPMPRKQQPPAPRPPSAAGHRQLSEMGRDEVQVLQFNDVDEASSSAAAGVGGPMGQSHALKRRRARMMAAIHQRRAARLSRRAALEEAVSTVDWKQRQVEHHAAYDAFALALANYTAATATAANGGDGYTGSTSGVQKSLSAKLGSTNPGAASTALGWSAARHAKLNQKRRMEFWSWFSDYDYQQDYVDWGDFSGGGSDYDYDYMGSSGGSSGGGSSEYFDYFDDFTFFDYFDDGFFDTIFWGDYSDGSSGSSNSSDVLDLTEYFFGNGTVPSDFGASSSFYRSSCYNRSVNVYSYCRDGRLASQWLDRSGQVQTSLDALTATCKQACGSSGSGQDSWYRYYYNSRQADSRQGTQEKCEYLSDYFVCHGASSSKPPSPRSAPSPPSSTSSSTPSTSSNATSWLMFLSMEAEMNAAAAAANKSTAAGSQTPANGSNSFAVCGKTCAPDCSQAMLADGRPDPACNYASCCFDGADYEVWILDKISSAQRLSMINTDDALQEAVRQLGEACNLQKAYDKNPNFGDDLQRFLVVAACRLQMSLYGGSDITGLQVPTVMLSTRSEFKSSLETMLSALKLLDAALLDASNTADRFMQLLQQYFYRSADDPTNWAALQPTFHGSQLDAGDLTMQEELDLVTNATMQSDLVGGVLQRQFRDTYLLLGAIDVQGAQAKQLLNQQLRTSALQEALLTSPTGLLLLPPGKQLPDGKGSVSFSVMDEWGAGDVLLYGLPSGGSGAPSMVVTAPMPATRPPAPSSSTPSASPSSSPSTPMTYAHFISLALAVDNTTGAYVFVMRGVPSSSAVADPPPRYSLQDSDGRNYIGAYMVHRKSGIVLVPAGDRVLLQGVTLEDVLMAKAAAGPGAISSYSSLFQSVGSSAVSGNAWDTDGDGNMSVDELWAFLDAMSQVEELGLAIWDEWRKDMYEAVWSKGLRPSWGGLLDGYIHPDNVSYTAVEGVASLLRRSVGVADGMTHSFWGFSMWDADHDGVISQADVLRTIGYMGLIREDGYKLVTHYYSSYGAAVSNTTANATQAGHHRRSMAICGGSFSSGGSSSSGTNTGSSTPSSGSSSSGGSSTSSTSSRPASSKTETSWSSAVGTVGKVLDKASSAASWVAGNLMEPLSGQADSSMSSLMAVTSTAAEAGSVLSDCASAAKGALKGGWWGIAGAGISCLGSVAEATLPAPIGTAVNLVAQTVSTAIDIVTAPAKAVASVVWEGAKAIGSAIGSLFDWFGRRRLTQTDCTLLSGLFDSAVDSATGGSSGGSGSGGSEGGMYSWLLSDISMDTAFLQDNTAGFFDSVFSADYDYQPSVFDMTLGGDYDYQSMGLMDMMFSGDYDYDYGSSGFDWMFDGSSGDYSDSWGGDSGWSLFDYDYDYVSSGSSFDYGGGFFGWFDWRRAMREGNRPTAAVDKDTEAAATATAAATITVSQMEESVSSSTSSISSGASSAPVGENLADVRHAKALRKCTSGLLDMPLPQARACVRLLAATAAAAANSRDAAAAAEAPTPADNAEAAAGAAADETLMTGAAGGAAGAQERVNLRRVAHRVAMWLARQCYEREGDSANGVAAAAGEEPRRGLEGMASGLLEGSVAEGDVCSMVRADLRRRLLKRQAKLQQQLQQTKQGKAATEVATAAVNDMPAATAAVAETAAATPSASAAGSKQRVELPKRPQRDARRRRRLAAAASGNSAQSDLQAKLEMFDETMNEVHRIAQIGFISATDQADAVSSRRTAAMKSFLLRNNIPLPAEEAAADSAATAVAGASSSRSAKLPLSVVLGLQPEEQAAVDVATAPATAAAKQRQAKAISARIAAAKATAAAAKVSAAGSEAVAKKATTSAAASASGGTDDSASSSSGSGGGALQSRMTQRFWGSLAERKAAATATSASSSASSLKASKDTATSATTTAAATSSGSATSAGSMSSPYLGPDVPPPVLSLSDIDKEMNGDFLAGRPQDKMFRELEPFLGPSFEGMGRGLAGMTRNLWAALDAVSGAQQVRSWLDIFLELQNSIAESPAVCTAGDLTATLKDTKDKPGQWAAAATLRGRGGVLLVQMYRSLIQTYFIRQLRGLALQYEMSRGAPSRLLAALDAAVLNISSRQPSQPLGDILQRAYDIVQAELPLIPEAPANATSGQQSAPPPPQPPLPTAATTTSQPPSFGSNIAVSGPINATVYFTLTARTHAHVMRNLTQGLAASVQVPLPRQSKYFDVRMTGVAVRVLADHSQTVTVQQKTKQSSAVSPVFQDALGMDMVRACVSTLSLPSADADVAAAVKGPISFYYPDPVAALSGRAVSYNHPVPAAFCNVFCPSSSAGVSYSTSGSPSASIGRSLYSPYGTWLLQYRPRAGQAGFIKGLAASNVTNNASYVPDCSAVPCTYFRAEALQFEFNITYREVTSSAFLGNESSSFFGKPAGDPAASLQAGIAPASPSDTDPYKPVSGLPDERSPLAGVCSYRTSNNSMRALKTLNDSYSSVTPLALAARTNSAGAYANFPASYTSEPKSQINMSVTMYLGGISLSDLRGNLTADSTGYQYDTPTAKKFLDGIKSFIFQGPAGVGEVRISGAVGPSNSSNGTTSRRSLLSAWTTTAATAAAASVDNSASPAAVTLEPVIHVRPHHWHPAKQQRQTVAPAAAAPAAGDGDGDGNGDSGGDEGSSQTMSSPPVVAPSRLVYRKRRQLADTSSSSSSGGGVAVTVAVSGLDVVTGNQAASLLNNGDRADATLQQSLKAKGINAVVQVASVGLGTPASPSAKPVSSAIAAPPPPSPNAEEGGGKKGLGAGPIAGIVVGGVAGAAIIVAIIIIIIVRRKKKVSAAPW